MNDKRTTDEIDALAQEIRRVDGENNLGAGALAEALQPFLTELQHRREAEAGSVSVPVVKLLELREALVEQNGNEAYHVLYSMADPLFERLDPWDKWEAVRAASPYSPASGDGKHATSETAMRECLSKISALAHDWMTDAKLTVPRARQTLGDIVTLSEGWSSSPASGVRVSEEQQEKEAAFVAAGGAKRVDGHYSNADTGVVGTVPTEVYLSYEAQAKEIAARSETETQTAIKNSILLFVLKARMAENEQCAALIEDRGKNNVGRVHPVDAGHAAAIRSRLSALGEHP